MDYSDGLRVKTQNAESTKQVTLIPWRTGGDVAMTSGDGEKEKQMLEQHYTPAQLAKRWGFSDDFVRELFRGEEGVIAINRPEKMHKRGYVTLRIPESAAERVYSRLIAKRPTSLARVELAEARKRA